MHVLENTHMPYIISGWWEHLADNYKNEFVSKERNPNHIVAISFQTLLDFIYHMELSDDAQIIYDREE